MSDYLIHYGTPRHSGRYPYGSGDQPFQSVSATRRRELVGPDGKLTPIGEKYANRIQNSRYLSWNQKTTARATYRDMESLADYHAKSYTKSSDRLSKKSQRALSKGKEEKAEKYKIKSQQHKYLAERFSSLAESYHKTLDSIESGKLIAGKDFIVDDNYGNISVRMISSSD